MESAKSCLETKAVEYCLITAISYQRENQRLQLKHTGLVSHCVSATVKA